MFGFVFQVALRGFLVILALSLHAIFEGMAVGLTQKARINSLRTKLKTVIVFISFIMSIISPASSGLLRLVPLLRHRRPQVRHLVLHRHPVRLVGAQTALHRPLSGQGKYLHCLKILNVPHFVDQPLILLIFLNCAPLFCVKYNRRRQTHSPPFEIGNWREAILFPKSLLSKVGPSKLPPSRTSNEFSQKQTWNDFFLWRQFEMHRCSL